MMQQQGPPPPGATMPTASFPFELKGVPGGAKVEVNVHVVASRCLRGLCLGLPPRPTHHRKARAVFLRGMCLRGNNYNNNNNNNENNKKAKVAPVAAAESPTVDSKGNTNNGSRSGSNRYPGGCVGDMRSVTTQLEVVELSPPSDVKLREKWTRLVGREREASGPGEPPYVIGGVEEGGTTGEGGHVGVPEQ